MSPNAAHQLPVSPLPARRVSLSEVAAFFLRLGVTAFGGPAAHIAMMEDDLVRRRRWLTRDKFLDLFGASNLIPGPSSSELAIHIGYLCAGWPGLLAAGFCFILPAACIVGVLAWAYVTFARLPAVSAILYGVKPVVIALILQALYGLSRTAIKSKFLAAVALASLVLAAVSLRPLLLLVIAGLLATLPEIRIRIAQTSASAVTLLRSAAPQLKIFGGTGVGVGAVGVATPFSFASLFLVFLKIGAVVFGSGYVLLAFLRADLVVHRGWLTDSQLIDAVAIGQITPGPVFTTATFIGYLLGGTKGAALATLGIFLPAFLLVAASGPLVPHIRKSKLAGSFLDGVIVASLALMAVVAWQLGRASLVDAVTIVLALASLVALLRFRLNSAWLVLTGAAAGLLVHLVKAG